MKTANGSEVIQILLVEDNPGDVLLTKEALRDDKLRVNLNVVVDGEEAMAFLRKEGRFTAVPRPDLILLDLNLPKKDGRQVLSEIKADDVLKCIPVVILTTSQAEEDILRAYRLSANCYVQKPIDLEQFIRVVRSIESFWFTVVKLPSQAGS